MLRSGFDNLTFWGFQIFRPKSDCESVDVIVGVISGGTGRATGPQTFWRWVRYGPPHFISTPRASSPTFRPKLRQWTSCTLHPVTDFVASCPSHYTTSCGLSASTLRSFVVVNSHDYLTLPLGLLVLHFLDPF